MSSLPGFVDTGWRRTARGVLLACMLLSQAAVGLAQDNADIRLEQDLVWVDSAGLELRQLLGDLAVAAGFRLWIAKEFPRQPARVNLAGKPMKESLQKLLAGKAYALVTDDDSKVTALYLLPPGSDRLEDPVLDPVSDDPARQALRDALESSQLPNAARNSILLQLPPPSDAPTAPAIPLSPSLEKLMEAVQRFDSLEAVNPGLAVDDPE